MTIHAVLRLLAGAILAGLLVTVYPSASARADGDPVNDAYSYRTSDCDNTLRSDPLTLVFYGNAFNGPDRVLTPLQIAERIERDAFPTSGAIGGGTQYALNGSSCAGELLSFGREFGPSRSVTGASWAHREKKHVRLFNTREGTSDITVSGSPHRERKVYCPTPPGPGDAVYKRYNGQGGFDAAAQEQASVLRSKGYDVERHPTINPVQTVFVQCNSARVPWSGNVYRVNVEEAP